MKLKVTFIEKNPNFSKECAEQYWGGKESENNRKDNFNIQFGLDAEIDKIDFIPNTSYNLIGSLDTGKLISLNLPNMAVLNCIKDGKIYTQFSVSKNLLQTKRVFFNEKYNITRFYFYLKPNMDYNFLGNNVCILKDEIPSELH